MTGWDKAAAIGSLGGAVATAAAVIAALVVAGLDRRAALKLAEEDRAAAQSALTAQIDAAQTTRAVEHEIDLLLRLAEQVAELRHGPGSPQSRVALVVGRALTLALPDTDGMPATRELLLPGRGNPGLPSVADVYGLQAKADTTLVAEEIAGRLRQIANRSQS